MESKAPTSDNSLSEDFSFRCIREIRIRYHLQDALTCDFISPVCRLLQHSSHDTGLNAAPVKQSSVRKRLLLPIMWGEKC